MSGDSRASRLSLPMALFIVQAAFLVLFGAFGQYGYNQFAKDVPANTSRAYSSEVVSRAFYPMFQDVHVMMFIGFGFLMTFLKRYGLSAVSLNFVVAALVLQWYMIMISFYEFAESGPHITVTMRRLIFSDFAAAAVLISFGAVIGKASPYQLVILAMMEIVFFTLNEWIAFHFLEVTDVGGSMIVHAFGAYFGLAVAACTAKWDQRDHTNEGSTSTSDMFSMIGTVFLWLFWPSFNSAIADSEDLVQRAVINTYLSLAACVLSTFAVSSLVDARGRLNMVHVQNATLAGGVAVGTSANLLINPWGAILIGIIAGALSVIGFTYIQPFLQKKVRLHDTCGVHNLHGMPAVMAGIVAAIVVATTDPSANNQDSAGSLETLFPMVAKGKRSLLQQGGYQFLALCVSIAIGLVGGVITGLVMRFLPWRPEGEDLFNDSKFFVTEEEGEPHADVDQKYTVNSTELPVMAPNGNKVGNSNSAYAS